MQVMAVQGRVVLPTMLTGFKGGLRPNKVVIGFGPLYNSYTPSYRSYHLGTGENVIHV